MARHPFLKHCEKSYGDNDTGMYYYRDDYWQHDVIALAEFPDGKIRVVRLNMQADTYSSWPGRASYRNTTIRCFVTNEDGRIKGHYNTSDLQRVL